MKILIEDGVSNLIANNLSEYDGDLSQHKPSLMRNDYPTAQWIAAMPDHPIELLDNNGNPSGKFEVSSSIIAEGHAPMNGIYLGNFIGDRIKYKIWEEDPTTNIEIPLTMQDEDGNISTEVDVPIRVFQSFGHFVRGAPTAYQDYFYTLKELGFNKEYLYNKFKLEVTISSNTNLLVKSNEVSFHVQSIIRINATYNGAQYYKIRGQFQDSNGAVLSIDSSLFDEPLHVGMIFMGNLDSDFELDGSGNPTTTKATRICQITEIVGTGVKDNAISMLIRDYETAGTEEAIEDRIDGNVNFVDELINNRIVQISDYDDRMDMTYLFRSMRVGLIRAGYVEHFPNPQIGLSRTYRDYSIRKSLINGGHQYSNRNIAKIYSGQLVLDRDRVRRFLTFVENQRAKPFPVEVLSGWEEETPTVFYGYFASTPSESLSQRTGVIRNIDFSIQQVF